MSTEINGQIIKDTQNKVSVDGEIRQLTAEDGEAEMLSWNDTETLRFMAGVLLLGRSYLQLGPIDLMDRNGDTIGTYYGGLGWRRKSSDARTFFDNNGFNSSALPTTDPQINGQFWNDNGTVKVSSGT